MDRIHLVILILAGLFLLARSDAARILHFNITPTLLMENDTFNISCNLQANPPPTWSIRNRDTGLVFMSAYGQGADALLTSPPALCEYTGYWECTGYNNLSEHGNVTQGNDVTILCSPRPVYQGNNFTVKSEVGQAAYLVMHLISHPVSTYRWSRDDGSNFTDDVIQHDYDNKTILEFPSVSIYDFGVYTLTMTNIYGSYTSKYQLTATGKPEPPTDVKYRDVTEHDVTLSWTPGYDMGSKQYFLVMMFMNETKLYLQISSEIYCPYKNLQPNQTCTHTQENLNGNSHYNLKIAAKNDYRYVSFSNESVEFTTKVHPTKPDSNYLREVIIGITIGGICFVCIVAAIVFFQKKRRLSSYISIAS
ncbi:Immunoglobulin C1-set domain [Mactra antiquata]